MALPKIHPSNLIYIAICLLGVAAFVLVGIYPNSLAMGRLENDIAVLSQQVQVQELLHPVYRELVKEVQQNAPAKMPLPEAKKIARNDLGRINDLFVQIARQSDVVFESAVPDASSYLEESGHITMNVVFSGDFFNMRKLLIGVCGLPYLDSIEQMRLEAADQIKRIHIRVKLAQE